MTGSDSEQPTGVDIVVDGLRELGHDASPAAVMQLTTSAAVASLAGAADAGLTLLSGDRFTTLAPTSDLPITVDALRPSDTCARDTPT